jgi:hypothetical protein
MYQSPKALLAWGIPTANRLKSLIIITLLTHIMNNIHKSQLELVIHIVYDISNHNNIGDTIVGDP